MTIATDAAAETGDDDAAFGVGVSRRDGIDVVAVTGDLDVATAVRLREVLLDPLLCGQPGLVVDLSSVTFCDSTGIGTLVGGWRRARERGASYAIACPEGQVLRVLKLVALHDLVVVAPSLDDAVAVLTAA